MNFTYIQDITSKIFPFILTVPLTQSYFIMLIGLSFAGVMKLIGLKYRYFQNIKITAFIYTIIFIQAIAESVKMMKDNEYIVSSLTVAVILTIAIFQN